VNENERHAGRGEERDMSILGLRPNDAGIIPVVLDGLSPGAHRLAPGRADEPERMRGHFVPLKAFCQSSASGFIPAPPGPA
jgi:hypothetical protein